MVKAFGLFILGFFFFSLTFGTTLDLINAYCGGNSYNCYLCTNGQQIARCNLGCRDGSRLEGNQCIIPPSKKLSVDTLKVWALYSKSIKRWILEVNGGLPRYICGNKSERQCYITYNNRRYYCYIKQTGWIQCTSRTVKLTCPKNYTLQNNQCVRPADWVCPLGNYQCYNPANTPTQNTDTPEGANDIQNNGQVTAQGCLGTIYIFNGHDYRCRPPGIQTGFSDCCKKEHTWFGLGMCSQRERYLSRLRAWGQKDGKCHYIGEYCAEKWLGTCVQRKKTFCCYSSPLARIIIEAAHQQLGIPWGDPKHPNCRGLTPEEFQKLDFSKIDFSEWVNYEIQQNIVPSINTSLQNALNNMQTTVSTSVPSSP